MKKRLTALVMSFLLGLLLFHFRIPIPFMLSGIVSASVLKFFIWTDMRWPLLWRNLGLLAAGYGIGRSFTHETLVQMSQHVLGVFGASFVAIGISLLVAWFTYKHTFANLLSCIMGMLPGGLNQMMLLADEDPRVDANVVVMQQTIRLFGVVISVPFLVIHLLGATVVPQGLLAPVGPNTGITWLILIPVAGFGFVAAKKLKVPTAALIGPIIATAAFSIICNVHLQKPPPILMNLATALQDKGAAALCHHWDPSDYRRKHCSGGNTGTILRNTHCDGVSGHGSRRYDGDVPGRHEHGGRCVHYTDVPDCAAVDDEPDGSVLFKQIF